MNPGMLCGIRVSLERRAPFSACDEVPAILEYCQQKNASCSLRRTTYDVGYLPGSARLLWRRGLRMDVRASVRHCRASLFLWLERAKLAVHTSHQLSGHSIIDHSTLRIVSIEILRHHNHYRIPTHVD
eukprot:scaffold150157_cov62-Attheya_sp.AAC.3